MIPTMCEQFVARAALPFRLDDLWPLARAMERYGIAGFGWGIAWLGADGSLTTHRAIGAFADDPAVDALGATETTSVLVHLRRPSKLSTLQLPDTQPFADPRGRFAFAHNGDFAVWRPARTVYRDQGRINGRADSEVAQRRLEDAWSEPDAAPGLLASLHADMGGPSNLALIDGVGTVYHHAGNRENPVFSFRLGSIGIVSTGLYSIDRSLFAFAAHGATNRRLVRLATTITLDQGGVPSIAAPTRPARHEQARV